MALQDHCEIVGVKNLDIAKTDKILNPLLYTRERNPNMWWGDFKRLLNETFTT